MTGAAQVFAIVGPSGAGKDALIRGAMAERPDLRLVRRVITRPTDAGGEDFDGVSETEFLQRKAEGAFALDWQAHGLRYGIPRRQIEGPGPVLFNGSRAALPEAVRLLPALRIILITAPEPVLAARLAARGREGEADIRDRLSRAAFAMPGGLTFDIVTNDGSLAAGVARLLAALQPVRA